MCSLLVTVVVETDHSTVCRLLFENDSLLPACSHSNDNLTLQCSSMTLQMAYHVGCWQLASAENQIGADPQILAGFHNSLVKELNQIFVFRSRKLLPCIVSSSIRRPSYFLFLPRCISQTFMPSFKN